MTEDISGAALNRFFGGFSGFYYLIRRQMTRFTHCNGMRRAMAGTQPLAVLHPLRGTRTQSHPGLRRHWRIEEEDNSYHVLARQLQDAGNGRYPGLDTATANFVPFRSSLLRHHVVSGPHWQASFCPKPGAAATVLSPPLITIPWLL